MPHRLQGIADEYFTDAANIIHRYNYCYSSYRISGSSLIPKTIRSAETVATTVIKEMIQGFRYIWGWKGLESDDTLGITEPVPDTAFYFAAYFSNYTSGRRRAEIGMAGIRFRYRRHSRGLILGAWGGFKKNMVTVLLELPFRELPPLPSASLPWIYLCWQSPPAL